MIVRFVRFILSLCVYFKFKIKKKGLLFFFLFLFFFLPLLICFVFFFSIKKGVFSANFTLSHNEKREKKNYTQKKIKNKKVLQKQKQKQKQTTKINKEQRELGKEQRVGACTYT